MQKENEKQCNYYKLPIITGVIGLLTSAISIVIYFVRNDVLNNASKRALLSIIAIGVGFLLATVIMALFKRRDKIVSRKIEELTNSNNLYNHQNQANSMYIDPCLPKQENIGKKTKIVMLLIGVLITLAGIIVKNSFKDNLNYSSREIFSCAKIAGITLICITVLIYLYYSCYQKHMSKKIWEEAIDDSKSQKKGSGLEWTTDYQSNLRNHLSPKR